MSNRKSPKPIFLVDERSRQFAVRAVNEQPADGSIKVTISGAKDKSSRQRGLQWIWYGDIVKAGIGGEMESNTEDLHLACKARWCLPLQIRDDDDFADVYLQFHNRWHRTPQWDAKFLWFVERVVSTEDLNQAQMAEYLTQVQDHYGHELGVNLTDPAERGWANLLEVMDGKQ